MTIKELLSEQCKDMGLTDKALEKLAELAGGFVDADASDDVKEYTANKFVPIAREMQAEVTRKLSRQQEQAAKAAKAQPAQQEAGALKEAGKDAKAVQAEEPPAWFAKALEGVRGEIESLKAAQAANAAKEKAATRQEQISQEARKLGIPAYIAKRLNIADEADIAKELQTLKQDMIADALPSEGGASRSLKGGSETDAKDAEAWAKQLPDKAR